MKHGRTITELAKEVDRQRNSRRDFVAPDANLEMTNGNGLNLTINQVGVFGINDLAHDQIGSRLQIPSKYYDKLRHTAPTLLRENVNHWLTRSDKTRLVRTLDGTARAFLSDRYRPLDNYELLEAILPTIQDNNLKLESCEITERKLYIKAINERVQGEVKKDDIVQAGVLITNSETGCGSLSVQPLIYRLVCENGMIMNTGKRKYHTGGRLEHDGDGIIYQDDTRQAADKALWLQTRDMVKSAVSEAGFNQNLDILKIAAGIEITGKIEKVVEVTAKLFRLRENETNGIMGHLIKGGDLSAYGLANATTQTAQLLENYDRSVVLERVGAAILELPQKHFQAA